MGSGNTLPLELRGLTTTVTTPVIYALGTVTTFVSFTVIAISVGFYLFLKRKKGI
jgi:putative spermidine/putrescine transport system permease protein